MLAMQSILATLESSVVCNELINILNIVIVSISFLKFLC